MGCRGTELERCFGQVIQECAGGFVGREKTFDTEFLQGNVQRRAQASKDREKAQR